MTRTLKECATAVLNGYTAGMSGADATQLQHLVDLGDKAREIIELCDKFDDAKEALRHLYTSATDTRNGYADRELHEPPATTIARVKEVLGKDLED